MSVSFPLKPGDLFFVGGEGWLNNLINRFQALWSTDGVTKYSHVGIIIDDKGTTFETTSWRTGNQSLESTYAGSEIAILRWNQMWPDRVLAGLKAVEDQRGRVYPYWRLLAHALRIHGLVHFRSMECSVLVAHFLAAARCPLRTSNLWRYDVEMLYDELAQAEGWSVVFAGSLRAAGLIV